MDKVKIIAIIILFTFVSSMAFASSRHTILANTLKAASSKIADQVKNETLRKEAIAKMNQVFEDNIWNINQNLRRKTETGIKILRDIKEYGLSSATRYLPEHSSQWQDINPRELDTLISILTNYRESIRIATEVNSIRAILLSKNENAVSSLRRSVLAMILEKEGSSYVAKYLANKSLANDVLREIFIISSEGKNIGKSYKIINEMGVSLVSHLRGLSGLQDTIQQFGGHTASVFDNIFVPLIKQTSIEKKAASFGDIAQTAYGFAKTSEDIALNARSVIERVITEGAEAGPDKIDNMLIGLNGISDEVADWVIDILNSL